MESNKRRKLNSFQETKNISAFAARHQLKLTRPAGTAEAAAEKAAEKSVARKVSDELLNAASFVEAGKTSRVFRLGLGQGGGEGGGGGGDEGDFSDSSPYEGQNDEVQGVGRKSRGQETVSEQALVQLTTVRASKDRVIRESGGAIRVKLAPGERVVALGEYGLSVIKGRITVLGATLSPDHTVHHVYALSSHSLPVIRYLESTNEEVVIRLSQLPTGLRAMKKLSPLFSRLWNESATVLPGEADVGERSSFQILFSTSDGPRKMFLQHVYSPPEWNETFAAVSSGKWNRGNTSTTMICGPKSSGKSTFAKLLVNRLLTFNAPKVSRPTATAKRKRPAGVLLLDLDPGQPEYSPPGQLSLVHLTKPNFGPPYAHPDADSGGCTVIRSHSVCAISPSADPDHYMACVSDLLTHCRHYIASNADCPLVINTPGWILGTGLELLVELIKQAKPTVVIYMSVDGPLDVVKSLRDEARQTPVITLPSQISEFTARTASQLRIMQTMSYFHLNPRSQLLPFWKPTPLTSVPPWVVSYAGEDAGILGIMCIGEQPPAELLKDAINGTLVAVVVVDDTCAIAGWVDESSHLGQDEAASDEDGSPPKPRSMVVDTPDEKLPYLDPEATTYLDPKHSHSIGVALVRGVDVDSRSLQLLTPISPKLIGELSHYGKSIVLVSGKLETPGWAYTEELYKKAAAALSQRRKELGGVDGDVDVDESEADEEVTEGFENAPWVERLEGHRGRGVGARVWKVRRDLGRSGDA